MHCAQSHKIIALFLGSTLLLMSTGCNKDVAPAVQLVAAGSTFELSMREGSNCPNYGLACELGFAQISVAESFDPTLFKIIDVLDEVTQKEGNIVRVKALRSGRNIIKLVSQKGDAVENIYEARLATRVALEPYTQTTRVLEGSSAMVPSTAYTADDEPLLGSFELSISGGHATVEEIAGSGQELTFHDAPTLYTIRSTIQSNEMMVETIPLEQVEEFVVNRISEGAYSFNMLAEGGGLLASADNFVIKVVDPTQECEVNRVDTYRLYMSSSVFSVASTKDPSLKVPCSFDVTVEGADDGAGITHRVDYMPSEQPRFRSQSL